MNKLSSKILVALGIATTLAFSTITVISGYSVSTVVNFRYLVLEYPRIIEKPHIFLLIPSTMIYPKSN